MRSCEDATSPARTVQTIMGRPKHVPPSYARTVIDADGDGGGGGTRGADARGEGMCRSSAPQACDVGVTCATGDGGGGCAGA